MQKKETRPVQEQAVEAIEKGDLAAYKKLNISNILVNRPLMMGKALSPKPKYGGLSPITSINGPTVMIYAILCEQHEILQYILDHQQPDASIFVHGYNALHYAAMTNDWRCLDVLLHYRYFQENIDMAAQVSQTSPDAAGKTTALHCAVSNGRKYQAMLLLQKLPEYRDIPSRGAPKEEGKKPKTKDDEEEEEAKEPQEIYDSASADQLSAANCTPLFTAVFLRNPELVQILLAAGADTTVESEFKKTKLNPKALLAKMKQERDEKNAKRKPRKLRKGEQPKPCPLDQIEAIFANSDIPGLDDLKPELCPKLCEDIQVICAPDDEADVEDVEAPPAAPAPATEMTTIAEVAKAMPTPKQLSGAMEGEMLTLLRKISQSLDRMERQGWAPAPNAQKAPPVTVTTSAAAVHACSVCASVPAEECGTCHKFFCDRCMTKPAHNFH